MAIEIRDGYKIGHCKQYPKKTELVYSNLTARGSRIKGQESTVFFGLQYFIKRYLIEEFNTKFFNQPIDKAINEFKELMDSYLGPDTVAVDEIVSLHKLGFLPIQIKAVKEGTSVPLRVPMLSIVNTNRKFGWLTNALETLLSTTMWGPITSATTAKRFKNLLTSWAEKTGDINIVPFQAHDFSMRGMFGLEAGLMSGGAHLTSFVGTDTVPAINWLKEYYKADGLIGCSVPATEHSVSSLNICLIENALKDGGYNGYQLDDYGEYGDIKEVAEYLFIKEMITEKYPTGIISLVCDTYDFWTVVSKILPKLKDEIIARDGKVVIRPDTGIPEDIVCGIPLLNMDKDYEKYGKGKSPAEFLKGWCKEIIRGIVEGKTPHGECGSDSETLLVRLNGIDYETWLDIEWDRYDKQYYHIDSVTTREPKEINMITCDKGLIESLWDTFGGVVNAKGFKELDSHIGAIYGDAITYERANEISQRLSDKGFASTNIVYGVGSYTYQCVTRDTYNMAVKATYAEVGGQAIEIYKDPQTGDGTKKSLKGLIKVYSEDNIIKAKDQVSWSEEESGLLEIVFINGLLVREDSLAEIRKLNE